MKNVLITGGVGFIGSNLAEVLIELGYNVYSLDNYSFGSKQNELKKVSYYNLDIEEIDQIKQQIDICFHLAAMARVQPSFENPNEYFRVNTYGTTRVMEWAKKNNVKVVYAGSSSKHFNPSDSPYAMYKFLGEEVCKLYKKTYDVKVEIARFYNVYGPREVMHEKFGNVIGIWKTKVKNGEPLPIVGDGNQRRDFTHVNDIVSGLIKISKSNSINFEWELGSGKNYSINEVYKMFEKKFSCKVKYIENQPGNYKETLRKNDIAIDELGWTPEFELENYIQNL